jgi:hypothetical protein
MKDRLQTTVIVVALLAAGFVAGQFYRGPTIPPGMRAFGGCATDRQFLVEFRGASTYEREVVGIPIRSRGEIQLEADGQTIGALGRGRLPIRRFFCEGNHSMRVTFSDDQSEAEWQKIDHMVEFAVSRPSILVLTQSGMAENELCVVGAQCPVRFNLELLQDGPDEKRQNATARGE